MLRYRTSPGAAPGDCRVVPADLMPPEDPHGLGRHSTRDWLVDVGAVALAGAVGVVGFLSSMAAATDPVTGIERNLDIALGVAAAGLLWWRRRWPVAVGLVTAATAAFSAFAGPAAAIATFTAAVHRRTPAAALVAAANLLFGIAFLIYRRQAGSWWASIAVAAALVAIPSGWGMLIRARRQLLWTLRARVERAEADQIRRSEQARDSERARIAREMHDVLGHRLSLIALHAGGLEVRRDLPDEVVRDTARLLRETARQALGELRAVVGVLRERGSDAVPVSPQPRLEDIPHMVDEIRLAGGKIDLHLDVADVAPSGLGRDVYRIVQEGLTNVAKHAAGTRACVRINGSPTSGLHVSVRNPPAASAAAPAPGSGAGLLGLQERVALAEGSLHHGRQSNNDYLLEADLPWR